MSRARLVLTVVLALGLTSFAATAQAQEVTVERVEAAGLDFTPVMLNASAATSVRLTDLDQLQIPMAPIVARRPKARGAALFTSLYTSTVVMQGLDLHSTLKAFSAGAVEGNPIMAGVTRNKAAFIATKAAVATVTILTTRKLARKNKVAAVITLVAVNTAYALIAKHNYDLARR